MTLFTTEDLNNLVSATPDSICVSIFMPTHRRGRAKKQDPIRLKNILTNAEETLKHSGMRLVDARRMLKPAAQLIDDASFWKQQSDGLVIYLSVNDMRVYRLPMRFSEMLFVSEQFHIKPLFPLITNDGHFYVLALSQKKVRLFMATKDRIDDITPNEMPKNLKDALGHDRTSKSIQTHSADGHGNHEIVHGQGGQSADEKADLLRFFRMVDEQVMAMIGTEHAPLILASVDYLKPIYHGANTYSNLRKDVNLTGNPDRLSPKKIHSKAKKIIEPLFTAKLDAATEAYQAAANTSTASDEVEEIIPAAYMGKIDALFVTRGVQTWGNYSLQKNEVEVHSMPKSGDDDLLNVAVIETYTKGGRVYVLEEDDMPNHSEIAAVFRY